MSMTRWTWALASMLLFAPVNSSVAAQATALDRYVEIGVRNNLSIRQQEIVTEEAESRWSEARRGWLPSLNLEARYSRAEGGRSFEIPIGDLMNPVYGTLNDLLEADGRAGPFQPIDNQTIDFLRDREQDTRLRATQVVWNPALRASVRSTRLLADSEEAALTGRRRLVTRDIRTAYFEYANAARAVEILDAAVELVCENERSNRSLFEAELTTRDRVHRARAERLEVEEQRNAAETNRALAASYLNLLLDRESDAPIELDPAALRWNGSGLPEEAELVASALARRDELQQLDLAATAADAAVGAERGSSLPSVALAIDAGIQGREYGFGSDDRYLMASLVLSWEVTNGGAERSRVRSAQLRAERIRLQRLEAERAIRLEVERAHRHTRLALDGLESARERVQEAQTAFRLVSRRRDEGLATELEFLDARSALTRAELTLSLTETEVLIRLAELEYASGLNLAGFETAEENDR